MSRLFRKLMSASSIVITFLVITMILGIVLYIKTKKFKGTKGEVSLYGIFLGMSNTECIVLAFNMIQLVTVIHSTMVQSIDFIIYGLIILITSLVLVLYKFKSMLTNIINLINFAIQLVAIYFNQMLYKYQIQVGRSLKIQSIQIILIAFIILYAFYLFIFNLEVIVARNKENKEAKAE